MTTYDWKALSASLLPSLAPINSPKLIPPQSPKFPTFSELVGQIANEPLPKKEVGLFEGLLGGRPEILYEDLLRNPEKYDPAVEGLLTSMLMGKKRLEDLTADEATLLNSSTFEFNQVPSISKEEVVQPVEQSSSIEELAPTEAEPFWWL